MKERTTNKAEGKGAQGNYADIEAERTKSDMRRWALQHAKERGAIVPESPIGHMVAATMKPLTDFWSFVLNARGAANAQKIAEYTGKKREPKRTSKLQKAIVDLVSLLNANARLLGKDDKWIHELQVKQGDPVPPSLIERTQQCLTELLGRIEQAGYSKAAPRKRRGLLVRFALNSVAGSGGWWPLEPTDENLAALSILCGVAFESFADDFRKRGQLAKSAKGGRGRHASHRDGLIHNEKKRCGGLRKSAAK